MLDESLTRNPMCGLVRSSAAILLLLLAALAPCYAAEYPARPITLLCWSNAGSPVDIYARVIARLAEKELGQPLVVENRTGGDGIIAITTMLNRPADGYTLLATTLTVAALFGEPGVTFKPSDLQPVVRSQIDPYGLMVPGSSPLKSFDDFLKYTRANPGKLNVAGPFSMGSHRVAWEVFAELAKVETNWIPYQGGGAVLTAVSGGHVDAAQSNPGNVKAQIQAGRVRLLAVSSERRLADFPDVPTFKEKGFDVVRYQWRGITAKAGTPKPVLDRLVAAFRKAQQSSEWKAYLDQVTQLDGFQGPEEFARTITEDIKETEYIKKKLAIQR